MGLFKKSVIRFDGTKEIETKIKNQTDNVISRRYKILIMTMICIGVFFALRLFITQIKQQDYYDSKLAQYNTNLFEAESFRGNIYDRNYERLVYNKNVNCATYYAVKGIKDKEIEVIINFLIQNVNVETEEITLREKKDYLIKKDKKYTDSLITEEERKENNRNGIYALQLQRITEEIINEKLTEHDLKFYKLYYSIKNCTNGSSVLLEGLSIEEASLIGENSSLLRGIKVTNDWIREYTYQDSFKQVLGKVTTKKQGLPATTKEILLAMDYSNDARVGTSGIEQQYESILSGKKATYSLTYDAAGNPHIKSVSSGIKGNDIRLTIDWEIQQALDAQIESELKRHTGYEERYNNHIYVILTDPNNGEIIAMSGKQRNPETGEIIDYAAGNYLNAYEIGSTFKGTTVYMGFKYNLIQPGTKFTDEPWIIKGTNPKKSWKNLGVIDEIQALSQSSNIYMFNIATRLGKGTYVKNQPLVIDKSAFDTVRKSAGELGLGVKTGIDVPTESLGYRGSSRQSGNLLDFVIGQYDTYTTIQISQYISTIANGGKRIQPHLFLSSFNEDSEGNKIKLLEHQVNVLDDVSEEKVAFERVQTGFREGAVNGLAKSVNGYYQLAGKTGTAQVFDPGSSKSIPNHAFVGYAPYNDPQISVSCMTERQEKSESCKPLSKFALTKYFDKYGVKSE